MQGLADYYPGPWRAALQTRSARTTYERSSPRCCDVHASDPAGLRASSRPDWPRRSGSRPSRRTRSAATSAACSRRRWARWTRCVPCSARERARSDGPSRRRSAMWTPAQHLGEDLRRLPLIGRSDRERASASHDEPEVVRGLIVIVRARVRRQAGRRRCRPGDERADAWDAGGGSAGLARSRPEPFGTHTSPRSRGDDERGHTGGEHVPRGDRRRAGPTCVGSPVVRPHPPTPRVLQVGGPRARRDLGRRHTVADLLNPIPGGSDLPYTPAGFWLSTLTICHP